MTGRAGEGALVRQVSLQQGSTMKSPIATALILATSLAVSRSLPTFPDAEERHVESLNDALRHVAKDSLQVLKSTSGVAQFVGQTAANAAIEAGYVAADYVKAIEVEAAVNETEDAIKAHKIAMIESVFDVKRQALRALQNVRDQLQASISAFVSASVNNINSAIATAQQGISVSKDTVVDLAAEVTIENTQEAIEDALTAVNDAIVSSADVIHESGNSLLASLVTAKEQLHDVAANFSSQEAFHAGELNLGLAVNASFHGAENVIDQLGVFQSLDNIVHGMADIPTKINSIIPAAINTTSEIAIKTIAEITKNDD